MLSATKILNEVWQGRSTKDFGPSKEKDTSSSRKKVLLTIHVSTIHLKYLWNPSTCYPGSSEGVQQFPKWSPCIYACHLQSVLQTAARILFWKCKSDHITPLLTTLQSFSIILLIQSMLPLAWHLAPAYYFSLVSPLAIYDPAMMINFSCLPRR